MAAAPLIGYLIKEGVRRSVAAREAGWTDIPAVIVEPGKSDVSTRLPLTTLYSPRTSTPRDYRYIRFVEYPTRVLKTEPPPIKVVPITSSRIAANATPLARVALT